jgi:hypothetical protein
MLEPEINKEEWERAKKAIKETDKTEKIDTEKKQNQKFQPPITGGLIPSASDELRWFKKEEADKIKKLEERLLELKKENAELEERVSRLESQKREGRRYA